MTEARKRIDDAAKKEEGAQKDLEDGNRDEAAKKETGAIKDLKDAQAKLEELLRQLREEEIERRLTALINRCRDMLRLQRLVRDGTVDVDGKLKRTPFEKMSTSAARETKQRIQELANTEHDIVLMAKKAIQLLKTDGTAVAFPTVFEGVHDDMVKVETRLRKTDVGEFTQSLENDIIESLKEMIAALEKAKKDNKKKSKPKPGKPGQQGKPGDKKLIDVLAELKMIRSMQVRLNKRTVNYHKFYPKLEQAPNPAEIKDKKVREDIEMVLDELDNQAGRQMKIKKILRDLATGKNK